MGQEIFFACHSKAASEYFIFYLNCTPLKRVYIDEEKNKETDNKQALYYQLVMMQYDTINWIFSSPLTVFLYCLFLPFCGCNRIIA
jgi:hypothetical protein